MNVPIRTFWLMNSNIDRIEAQKDMRTLSVAVHSQGSDAAQQHQRQLIVELGSVVKLDTHPVRTAVRDEEGFAALKEMATTM